MLCVVDSIPSVSLSQHHVPGQNFTLTGLHYRVTGRLAYRVGTYFKSLQVGWHIEICRTLPFSNHSYFCLNMTFAKELGNNITYKLIIGGIIIYSFLWKKIFICGGMNRI